MIPINKFMHFDELRKLLVISFDEGMFNQAEWLKVGHRMDERLERLILHALVEQWMHRHADDVLRKVGVDDVLADLRTALRKRVADALLLGGSS